MDKALTYGYILSTNRKKQKQSECSMHFTAQQAECTPFDTRQWGGERTDKTDNTQQTIHNRQQTNRPTPFTLPSGTKSCLNISAPLANISEKHRYMNKQQQYSC